MDGWTNRWMDGWMDGWMNGWMDGWMDEWTDRRMDGWMVMDRWTCEWIQNAERYFTFIVSLKTGADK